MAKTAVFVPELCDSKIHQPICMLRNESVGRVHNEIGHPAIEVISVSIEERSPVLSHSVGIDRKRRRLVGRPEIDLAGGFAFWLLVLRPAERSRSDGRLHPMNR